MREKFASRSFGEVESIGEHKKEEAWDVFNRHARQGLRAAVSALCAEWSPPQQQRRGEVCVGVDRTTSQEGRGR